VRKECQDLRQKCSTLQESLQQARATFEAQERQSQARESATAR
jgi:hypothetical protein